MTTMKPDDFSTARRQAELSFRRARKRAWRKQLQSWLSGREQQHLLPFEAIRAELPESDPRRQGVRLVPVDKIVGSVSRYEDFTRQFLPLRDSLRERWINVESLAMRRGWPPVELYQLGDVYFVSDGNHRVAVARQMGNDTIEAYVWSFPDVVKAGWRNMPQVYSIPVTGDSMEPTLTSGSYVFIDMTHVIPTPEDIYACDYGDGLTIKRLQMIPRSDKIMVMSDNDRYANYELRREDVRVYGRVVAWFQWRG